MKFNSPEYPGQYKFHPQPTPRGREFWLGILISILAGIFVGWMVGRAF